ncbi:hypothetical protein TorRG33x02_121630 [Trema orientale]|uniref:Uncharacterized protein n=1 Tax=Trema orientale TaxID=63057 RepID=A0A2P5F2T0_TREOI|nr:hypothetical protein TorRG33x02_121630 [Trema orientale]
MNVSKMRQNHLPSPPLPCILPFIPKPKFIANGAVVSTRSNPYRCRQAIIPSERQPDAATSRKVALLTVRVLLYSTPLSRRADCFQDKKLERFKEFLEHCLLLEIGLAFNWVEDECVRQKIIAN